MARRRLRTFVLPVGLAGLVVLIIAAGLDRLRSKRTPTVLNSPDESREGSIALVERPVPPPDDFVGSASCAECHAEISRSFARHPMGRSLAGVLQAEPIEDYGQNASFTTEPHSTYRIEQTAEKVTHHEILTDVAGAPIYDQAVDVRYEIGSGERGRGYVVDRGGLLFLSPISWYAGAHDWGLSPGYTPGAHPHFERRAADACLACHSGRRDYQAGAEDRYREPPFLEESIGCERCHGPGARHVERYRNGRTGSPDPIVNPADLEPARREAVCQQCHLLGEERLTRYGRENRDFRPGDRLEDVWTVYVHRPSAESSRERAVNQVEQMRASKCYTASGGELGCISCHDPHRVPPPEDRTSFFNARCLKCHTEASCELSIAERTQSPAQGSCIDCHMPRRSAGDVPHTSQTDHRILRRPPEHVPAADAPHEDAPPLELFDNAAKRLPRIARERADALVLVRRADATRDQAVAADAAARLKPILEAMPDDAESWEALGVADSLLNRRNDAIAAWSRAVKLDPNREMSYLRLARAYHDAGQFESGIAVLDRLEAINPWISELYGLQARMLVQIGQLDRSAAAAERAVELNPSLRQTYRSLAELHRLRGDLDASRKWRELYDRFPASEPASEAP